MPLEELRNWLFEQENMTTEFVMLQRFFAARGFSNLASNPDNLEEDLRGYTPDWQTLIPAASIFSQCSDKDANDIALLIAHAGILYSEDNLVKQAALQILTDAKNQRAITLSGLSPDGLKGLLASLSRFRSKIDSEIITANNETINASNFQTELWQKLDNAQQLAVSAPTASGKTYIVLQWILTKLQTREANLIIYLAPTRALVSEIERQLSTYSKTFEIQNLRIASLPFGRLGDGSQPTILVFTQERLHVFLNAAEQDTNVDLLIVDEAHKISERQRGIVLQEAIEKLKRQTSCNHIIQLSPLTENPQDLFPSDEDEPQTAIDERLMVTQNLILIKGIRGQPNKAQISMRKNGQEHKIGLMCIENNFNQSKPKTIFAAAYEIGKDTSGTLVYADGRSQAENIATLLAEVSVVDETVQPELAEFSDSIKQMIHPRYALKDVVLKGVGFHYGNMPTLVRDELERLFREGKLKYLVCTSTLVEGVNLAAKSIVTMGPQKGRGQAMKGQDFWNLAGRAGRWGTDFFGNVVCIKPDVVKFWPEGVPERRKYRIERATSRIHSAKPRKFIDYLERRLSGRQITTADTHYEYLFAYWLGKHLNQEQVDIAVDRTEQHEIAQTLISQAAEKITDIDIELSVKHPGVSAWSLQTLYKHFELNAEAIDTFIPTDIRDRDQSVDRYLQLFRIVDENIFPAFEEALLYPYALTTSRWMHGWPLSNIISKNWKYFNSKTYKNRMKANGKSPKQLPTVIRDTMRVVEEISRFKAPKYLSAYLDVLQKYLVDTGQEDQYPKDLSLDLYLEFGVATDTLLSLISIGLSRTSALALNDHIASEELSERDVFAILLNETWRGWQLPALVVREISDLLNNRSHLLS